METGKKVIIAEKPSLGRNLISGIPEKFQKKDGYSESENFIVTWGFGHLFGLKDIEEYLPDYDAKKKYPWKLDTLPFYPDKFQFTLKKKPGTKTADPDIKKQFETIKKLIHRDDVTKIYNCGDADREGEVIVNLILLFAKNEKDVYRIWTDDQTPNSLWEAILKAKPDREYKNVLNEGYARTYIDWLYGINLTRYVSIKAGKLERVGRCIIPIVRSIYDRDMEIKNFIPVKYYGIISETKIGDKTIILSSKNEFPKDEFAAAKALCEKYNSERAVVKDKKTERKEIKCGLPYNLTRLQNIMGSKYKLAPDVTLKTVQSLYEAGYISYPRTDSEYYAIGEKEKIADIIEQLKSQGYDVNMENKRVFNDAKVVSHGALRITKLAGEHEKDFTDKEKMVYDTVLSHMLAMFCAEKHVVDKTKIIISVGDYEEYNLNGSIVIQKGWTKYEGSEKKDKELPPLNIGDTFPVGFEPKEKETSPPKHYTIQTLNNFLKNPFKKNTQEDESEEDERTIEESTEEDFDAVINGLQIGTSATRAGIIANAISNSYIELKKGSYFILPNGIYLVETLNALNIDMDKYKTVEVGKILSKINQGEATIKDGVELAIEQIDSYINGSRSIKIEHAAKEEREIIGKCPICGNPVYESKVNFFCSNKDCNFSLFKENKWWTGKKKKITKTIAKSLLKNGKAHVKGLYSANKNKTYDADVIMDITDEKYVNFKLNFNK